MDSTNDPQKRSFIKVASESHFPIQNLPYGVCRPKSGGAARCCSAIGDFIIDLSELERAGLLPGVGDKPVFTSSTLNGFAELGNASWNSARTALSELLDAENAQLRDNEQLRRKVLLPVSDVELMLPMSIGDYTDFYSSKDHATNVGTMFRGPDNALQPNWAHMPIGYHGRASSVVVSGQRIVRPRGQLMLPDAKTPIFGPSQAMDFELEVGFYVGPGQTLGQSVSIENAEGHIFGLSLVNDWSARDIQRWEYVPLGPFLGKSFATSVSPWIVPLQALEPFRCDGPQQSPPPLPYLASSGKNTFDIQLEVALMTGKMSTPHVISRTNFNYLYWSMMQQLAHHTGNGCNLRPGDLLASGTISGPTPDSLGSMLEISWNGERTLDLPSGETRKMLEDGDKVIMTGFAQGDGYRVGFGEVAGELVSS